MNCHYFNYNSARHISCVHDSSDSMFRLGMIEVNSKELHFHPYLIDVFRPLLSNAWARIASPIEPSQFPALLAEAIEGQLSSQFDATTHSIFTLSFISLVLEREFVHVSWAGTPRAHLIFEDGSILSTRDHNLIDDPVEKFPPRTDPIFQRLDRFFSTRQLLAKRGDDDRLPESHSWEIKGRARVLVCSESFHDYRDPKEYIDNFNNTALLLDELQSLPLGGMVAVIEPLARG